MSTPPGDQNETHSGMPLYQRGVDTTGQQGRKPCESNRLRLRMPICRSLLCRSLLCTQPLDFGLPRVRKLWHERGLGAAGMAGGGRADSHSLRPPRHSPAAGGPIATSGERVRSELWHSACVNSRAFGPVGECRMQRGFGCERLFCGASRARSAVHSKGSTGGSKARWVGQAWAPKLVCLLHSFR